MTSYVFTPPAIPSVAVAGTEDRFPVRRIFCVGRNYAEHTREMGHDPDREPPFFFSLNPIGDICAYPQYTAHSTEFVMAGDFARQHNAVFSVSLSLRFLDIGKRPVFSNDFPIARTIPVCLLTLPSEVIVGLSQNGLR